MLLRSPIPTSSSASRVVASFSLGTDSPVKAASSICNELASIKRTSAGTTSPASRIIMSPGTNSVLLTFLMVPSRRTLALGEAIFRKASIASSALASWKTPIIAFKITTNKIIKASVKPSIPSATTDIAAATNKTIIMKSLNCSMNFCSNVVFSSVSSSLKPYSSCRFLTSASLKPCETFDSNFETTESLDSRYGTKSFFVMFLLLNFNFHILIRSSFLKK